MLVAALSASSVHALTADTPNTKSLSQLIVVSTAGQAYPQHVFNLAANPSEEPRHLGHITPLGQRQHFLVGSELRHRYVNEGKLLSEDYIVGQSFLQTPFVAKNIQSLQAQMMGLYPSSNQNDLSEWQQKNAVPPIEGADFSKWQEELGASALPFGLNTFPIQQTGLQVDFTLSLNEKNCPTYKAQWETESRLVGKKYDQIMTELYPTYAALIL